MLGRTGPAPYCPPDSLLSIPDALRAGDLSLPVTADAIEKIGVKGSLSKRTVAAARSLDLIDQEGRPTAVLQGLVAADEDEYRGLVEAWVRRQYSNVLDRVKVDDPPEQVAAAFANYEPAGQQSRMVSLFHGLCVKAGMLDALPTRRRGRGYTHDTDIAHSLAVARSELEAMIASIDESPYAPLPEPDHMTTHLSSADEGSRWVTGVMWEPMPGWNVQVPDNERGMVYVHDPAATFASDVSAMFSHEARKLALTLLAAARRADDEMAARRVDPAPGRQG